MENINKLSVKQAVIQNAELINFWVIFICFEYFLLKKV